ncbi:MAG: LysR substrate-binding domain-containing protein [Trebonia sp.]
MSERTSLLLAVAMTVSSAATAASVIARPNPLLAPVMSQTLFIVPLPAVSAFDNHPAIGWEDPTAGLASKATDVAFVWLPLPDPGRYRWTVIAQEPRLVAMSAAGLLARRLAERTAGPEVPVDFADLLDEPFLALPRSAGPLRDYWQAMDARDGKPPVIGAEISSVGETYEALMDGRGVVLLASGNAPLVALDGVITRPVRGLSPSRLAAAWRAGDHGPLVRDYARACPQTRLPEALSDIQLAA